MVEASTGQCDHAEMAQLAGFGVADAELIRRACPLVRPYFDRIATAFYRSITNTPSARGVLTGGEVQVERLRGTLIQWLESVFTGPYDASYHAARTEIGRAHVRVKMPQWQMFCAMSVVRTEVARCLQREMSEEPDRLLATVRAVNKLLDIDLAMMLESYREDQMRLLREAERTQSAATAEALGARLVEEQSFSRGIIENAVLGIFAVTPDGSVRSFNRKMEEITGYQAGELPSLSALVGSLAPSDVERESLRAFADAIVSGARSRDHGEFAIRRKGGTFRILDIGGSTIAGAAGGPVAGVFVCQDLTDQKVIEQRLIASERLAAIGELATSLAHEIKNPLAGISGAIQVIGASLSDEDEKREIIEEILHQVARLDATVRDLLIYARPRPLQLSGCDPNAQVERVLILLRDEPSYRNVTVEAKLSADVPAIRADADQIEQVLYNVLLNSAQAIEASGRIEVSTERRGPMVRIIVADDGPGMPDDVLEKAFQPFFTTKARGTGLGLPICRKIVESHEGQIAVRSQAHQGTVVTISLPIEGPHVEQGTWAASRS